MFDMLLKTKFYTKSKSAIKWTKLRIVKIKRKRKATQKYLKNDIADLLKNHLYINAYGRVEGLWNELNLSNCYDLIEKFCNHISSNLTNIDKQRECPDECREAASTLMFAAARFSDLPELQDLQNVFIKRYGTSLDHYINKEFMNKVKSTDPPTKDMKLQLMQDIATEKGVEWNVKSLEEKLFNPPVFHKVSPPGGEDCSKGEEEVDMKPFYYKTIRLPAYNKSKICNIPAFLNGTRILQIRSEIALCQQRGQAVDVYYNKMKKLWDALAVYVPLQKCSCSNCSCDVNARLSKARAKERIHQFLMGLDAGTYDTLRSHILSQEPLPSIGCIYALVLQKERDKVVIQEGDIQPEGLGLAALQTEKP